MAEKIRRYREKFGRNVTVAEAYATLTRKHSLVAEEMVDENMLRKLRQVEQNHYDIDIDRFVKVLRYRYTRLSKAMESFSNDDSVVQYVCPNAECEGQGKAHSMMDVLEYLQLSKSFDPTGNPSNKFFCPYRATCESVELDQRSADGAKHEIKRVFNVRWSIIYETLQRVEELLVHKNRIQEEEMAEAEAEARLTGKTAARTARRYFHGGRGAHVDDDYENATEIEVNLSTQDEESLEKQRERRHQEELTKRRSEVLPWLQKQSKNGGKSSSSSAAAAAAEADRHVEKRRRLNAKQKQAEVEAELQRQLAEQQQQQPPPPSPPTQSSSAASTTSSAVPKRKFAVQGKMYSNDDLVHNPDLIDRMTPEEFQAYQRAHGNHSAAASMDDDDDDDDDDFF
eukprot:TRINITY_DN66275_c4_g5_i1.p1 TRINITY_DN66275_c4_g5~~TRINITY_DN66275_c4_g5_i1.p1  ORF type:complete len:452 (-),score=222.57 TRINITY_DN66275_c4_g5_i1:22-1212(-)